MSLIKTFVDAFKKASTAKTDGALEHARSDGVLGPTTGDAAGSFTPLRPAPAPSGDGAGGDYKIEQMSNAKHDFGKAV